MTDRELLQQALDMLDDINQCSLPPTGIPLPAEIDHVMEALRARLAQPELPLVRVEEFVELIKGNEGIFGRPVMRTEWPTEEKPWVKTYSGGKPNYTQPIEQEPVAWMHMSAVGNVYYRKKPQDAVFNPQPLYTAPPKKEWVGLTDEEIEGAIDEGFAFGLDDGNVSNKYVIRYARAIEVMLKEKNG